LLFLTEGADPSLGRGDLEPEYEDAAFFWVDEPILSKEKHLEINSLESLISV
jgi:hypothetical protein